VLNPPPSIFTEKKKIFNLNEHKTNKKERKNDGKFDLHRLQFVNVITTGFYSMKLNKNVIKRKKNG